MAKEAAAGNPKLKEYLGEISAYNRVYGSWLKRAKAIVKRYRDDENTVSDGDFSTRGKNRFNILWSNVQTLQPALYARTPKPEVERRYKDKDPLGRFAAEIAERVGQYLVSQQSFDVTMRQVRDDFLLPGRGSAWVRYVPEFGSDVVGYEDEEKQESPIYEVSNEETKLDFKLWSDFGHNVTRTWEEVTEVWCCTYMYREQVKERFGAKVAEKISYGYKSEYADERYADEKSLRKKAKIIEFWCLESKSAYWICPDYKDEFLDEKKDPLKLRRFFPCPRPIYANLTTDSLVPIPDYNQYGRRAEDLNKMVAHREDVMSAIRVGGAYDASQPELGMIMNEKRIAKLVASKNWNQLQQAGGLKGVIDFIPIDMYVAALAQFDVTIGQEKAAIEELTGLSDIIRGYTSPSETATAQQIKGQFATLRLEDRQREIQRFARDCIEIMTEISLEHYAPEKIAAIIDIQQRSPEEQQMFPQALMLLRDDDLRTYRITIETDSTLNVDENVEKQKRTEAGEAIGKLLSTVVPMIQQVPTLAPILTELTLFMVRSFSAGRPLEFTLESSMKAMAEQLMQQQQGPPPEAQQAQAEIQMKQQIAQADMQMRGQKMQAEMQMQGQKAQVDTQAQQAQAQAQLQIEQQKASGQLQIEQAKQVGQLQLERERMAQEMVLKKQELDAQITLAQQKAASDTMLREKEIASRPREKLNGA